MRHHLIQAILVFLISLSTGFAQPPSETPSQRDARMSWWRDARFGMFIHWGIYSVPAKGEWYMNIGKVPIAEYEKYAPQFNPVKFDALAWVKLAKAAGMRYIVITSKHHDGFCMWDSKTTDYDIIDRTPFRRDVLKELAAACKQEGIRLCFYHSIMDWHHPDAKGGLFPKYREEYLKPQLKELLTQYGPIGVLWFDGDWISEWTEPEGKDLYTFVRSLQPAIIVNNRVGKGRNGMEGMNSDADAAGDFGTPEQEIPATGIPGVDWESCMTMNNNWGFNAADTNWKSTNVLIRNLVDIASKGGNYLLNVGPTSLGTIPDSSIERLKEIGQWMNVNGESIHGTTASPFPSTPWGRCTQKSLSSGATRLYLHVFDWPPDGILRITGLGTKPDKAILLASAGMSLPLTMSGDSAEIRLPARASSTFDAVVALDFTANVIVFRPPTITTNPPIFVDSTLVTISSSDPSLAVRYTTDGTEPTSQSAEYRAPVRLRTTSTVKARSFFKSTPVSSVTQGTFTQVTPHASISVPSLTPGLSYAYYEGDWDSVPDFTKLSVVATGTVEAFELGMKKKDEYYGVRFSGYIDIPTTSMYRFVLGSDDGSRLLIDGVRVVDNDGLHGTLERSGYCPLAAGLHAIEVLYFNKTGDGVLSVRMAKGGGAAEEVGKEKMKH